jgi:hypothetical protein
MLESIKQLIQLAKRSKKYWMIPFILMLVIVALLVIVAQISPAPVFFYPII